MIRLRQGCGGYVRTRQGCGGHVRGRRGDVGRGAAAFLVFALLGVLSAQTPSTAPVRGLTHATALAASYDAVLNADFSSVPDRLGAACGTVPVFCDVMDAVSLWWQIALDPENRTHDTAFSDRVERAIRHAESWTRTEPLRAEAWLARGAAYGARAQWRVLRKERLAAARDGKRIKEALETALAIDPEMHDAKFGIGMYRYYADVAPAAFRFLRWMLLLPGGDRAGGLKQLLEARDRGRVIRGEADYQLHLIFLWYEHRPEDALAIIRDLATRYPQNPLFPLSEADIQDQYFHDVTASEQTLRALIARADSKRVNQPTLARRRAQHAIASLHARTKR